MEQTFNSIQALATDGKTEITYITLPINNFPLIQSIIVGVIGIFSFTFIKKLFKKAVK